MASDIEEKTTSDLADQGKADLIKGSAWMTAGSIFSRILGAIYIIPWNMWFGSVFTATLANSLFSKGYNIYSFFLIISTAGIPGAISKQIAHYNALNEYQAGNQLFRQGLKIMALMGIVTAAVMYFGASFIANIFAGGNKQAIPVLQALSFALLIIPTMSLVRGYFQGYSQMAPSAISQFIEQVARVIYMLVATYWIMKVQKGSYVSAVTQSTFAAFIGAIFGLGILVYFLVKQLPKLRKLSQNSKQEIDIDNKNFFLEIMHQALPFIILDSGIVLFQIFDQATFNSMMSSFQRLGKDTLDYMYALFGFNANKLIMIVVSLATAMAVTAVPLLSAAYSRHDRTEVKGHIGSTLQLFFLVMLPASLGMYAVAKPLYILFYRYDSLGIYILQFSAIVAIVLGLFTVLAAVLQGLYQNKVAIKCFVIGFIVKMIVQYPMILLFSMFGPLMATMVGMTVTCWFMLRHLRVRFKFNIQQTLYRVCLIFLISVLMLVIISVINLICYHWLANTNRIAALCLLIVEVIIGVGVYLYLILKTRLAEKIVGSRLARLRQKLRIS
ncbi:putative polysaccharide biosynthesis protein [Bombilactobacillus thymidiniphilus]|uniref:Polysaccharide biosynthesis protein n=1 Tax=Bombilactobacillus thymidiniphilus TaxID=2923363 RepID=A0ABY4PDV8_9LACO|nr:polysaccharide biosynthesis protein [Bombilactobacillus thymidiniphilus]UQS83864.1 polysaccharide biosynthesis protein [Bombilactobacillus thymidiniphilus]